MVGMKTKPPSTCVSIDGAAKLLSVGPLTVRRLIKSGRLPASKVGRRTVIRIVDLDKLLADNRVEAAS
jgi:excisionase family DNA binding protein